MDWVDDHALEPKWRLVPWHAKFAGGVGLNLQHAATACVNLGLPWNPAVLEQRIARIHRLGQKEPVQVYNLVSRGCIEARIAGVVADKQELFRGVFDGQSDEVLFEESGSFLDGVRNIVEEEPPVRGDESDGDEVEDLAPGPQLEELLESADEAQDTLPAEPAPASAVIPTGNELRELISRISVRPREDGGLQVEAPPDAAASLAGLFEGLADLLRNGGLGRAPSAEVGEEVD